MTVLCNEVMKVFESAQLISNQVIELKKEGKKVGFVPTMGALHDGHISLIERAKEVCDVVIVSVFVNPTQFNNSKDLEKYPRTLVKDLELLAKFDVDLVFSPSIEEVYPTNYKSAEIELANLDKVMEGEFRPGHFQGVVEVVKRLFEIVQPDYAYFGQKDFQQVAIIKYMVRFFDIPVVIVSCSTIRNDKGLALSSRNIRLSETEKEQALVIYKSLIYAKENTNNYSPDELMKYCTDEINKAGLRVEYVAIINPTTLETLSTEWVEGAVCCIAAYCGDVRLIDNMILMEEI